jgi:hypothetical protein
MHTTPPFTVERIEEVKSPMEGTRARRRGTTTRTDDAGGGHTPGAGEGGI